MSIHFAMRCLGGAIAFASMTAFAQMPPLSGKGAPAPRSLGPDDGHLDCAVAPTYPPAALRARVTGASVLRILVSPDGVVIDAHVLRPSGVMRENALLDDTAVEAARACRYVRANGRPASGNEWAIASFDWRIEGDPGNAFATGPLAALRERAEQGDPSSAHWLYLRSGFDDASMKEALRWLQLAADRGMVRAQFELGRLYALGEGSVAIDAVQAAKWMQRASEQRDQRATMALAHLLLESDGPPRDPARAIELLQQAARNDRLAPAMILLGDVEAAGTAVPRDDKAAFDWWHRAAEANSSLGYLRVGSAWASGIGVRGADRALAATYFLMAQRSGLPEADARLADLHVDDEVLAVARKKAAKWEFDGKRSLPD